MSFTSEASSESSIVEFNDNLCRLADRKPNKGRTVDVELGTLLLRVVGEEGGLSGGTSDLERTLFSLVFSGTGGTSM